jgi:hypothetical protein
MEHNCERHTFEVADGVCRSCRGSFCEDCLLYPFGPNDQPYCKPCAIAAGGIRSTAGNTRREVSTPRKAKGRSGGLLSRLRRHRDPTEEGHELAPEELIELEATKARGLLDAQRLPAEPDEEPEPEPVLTPNIAPPGGFDEEPELAHRTMPDEIAGGLDLSDVAEPTPGTTPSTGADDLSPPAAPPGPVAAGPPRSSPVESSPTPAGDPRTADGMALFARAPLEPPEDRPEPVATVPSEAATSSAPDPVPVTVAAGAGVEGVVDRDDTRELLRRIAALRRR